MGQGNLRRQQGVTLPLGLLYIKVGSLGNWFCPALPNSWEYSCEVIDDPQWYMSCIWAVYTHPRCTGCYYLLTLFHKIMNDFYNMISRSWNWQTKKFLLYTELQSKYEQQIISFRVISSFLKGYTHSYSFQNFMLPMKWMTKRRP